MVPLALSAAAFFAIHVLVSGTSLRGTLVRLAGESAYLALFSLVSAAALVWLAVSYNAALTADNPVLWHAPLWLYHLAPVVMFPAVLLAVIGLLTPSPTIVRGEALLAKGAVRGIVTVSRHPFLWGAFLWAATHVAVNGDLASLVLFGMFLVLVPFGTQSIDRKRARSCGEAWESFAARTSSLPFVAIAQGRTKFDMEGLGLWRVLVALAVYGAVLFGGHACLFKVSPLPGAGFAGCPL
ncbi:MAG: NnrU family protein [Alphaproteobacteria bacterium]|nr:NnrU family protein [Alphaproteobacteria bacterium]